MTKLTEWDAIKKEISGNDIKSIILRTSLKGDLIEQKLKAVFGVDMLHSPQINDDASVWQDTCDYMRQYHPKEWAAYCEAQTEQPPLTVKHFVDKIKNANPSYTDYISQLNHRMLVVAKRQARTLTNAPSLEQHRFICELPETVWREVLEIVLEGADPIIWERNRNNYKPDTISKMQANIDRKRKNRRAYAKNGRVGRSKKSLVLNGCTANLGVA